METRRRRGDRALIGLVCVVVTLGLGAGGWLALVTHRPNVHIPMPPLPSPNGYDCFVAAGNALVDQSQLKFAYLSFHPKGQGVEVDNRLYTLAEKRALVAENAPALAFMRQGLALPCLLPPERAFADPSYVGIRDLGRLTFLEGEVHSARGDWNGAAQSDLDAVQMGERLTQGAPIYEDLIGRSLQNMGCRMLWSALPHLNAAQARAAARRLHSISAHAPTLADVLREEKYMVQSVIFSDLSRWNSRGIPSDLFSSETMVTGITLEQRQRLLLNLTTTDALYDQYTRAMDFW